MEFKTWLSLRMDELEQAILIKQKGGTQIWPEDDYCLHVDDYIEQKLSDIFNAVERALDKIERNN